MATTKKQGKTTPNSAGGDLAELNDLYISLGSRVGSIEDGPPEDTAGVALIDRVGVPGAVLVPGTLADLRADAKRRKRPAVFFATGFLPVVLD